MCTRCKLNEFCVMLADAVQNFECACRPGSKDKEALVSYHVQEISNHLDRIQYHVDQMMVVQSKQAMIRSSSSSSNNNSLPAEKIRHEIKLAEQKIRFKDKKLRRTSSLKYITKWEEILEKHWAQQNRKEYNYEGVNIIDSKYAKPKVYKSSDCILESEKEDDLGTPLAKSNSAGNLLETFNGGGRRESDGGHLCSEFLLSLRDLENIGKKYKLEAAKSCGALNEKRSLQRKKSADDVPRIVGVVYKMRL